MNLKALFPNGTKDFFNANPGLRPDERKQDSGSSLVDQAPGETKSDGRPIVSIKLYRVRLLDKDNAYASTKCLVDCLHQINLIPDDSTEDITLEVTQVKVAHYSEQKTEVKIDYP